jgi:fructokinase
MPRILGTGLVALDLIVEHYETDQRLLVGGGGTCGNVLAILARTGWQSSLIGAFDDSAWSQIMRDDLRQAGVELHGVMREESARPSLVVEHLERSGASAGRHWFSFVCPRCSGAWPGLRAAPDAAVRRGVPSATGQDVLFVDRLSEAVLDLAKVAKEQGSAVVYEPSSKADRPWLGDMLRLADVVKYSDERAGALDVSAEHIAAPLVVVTSGVQGSAWRFGGRGASWHHQPSQLATRLVDTCGAGDWFTAGLIHALFGGPRHLTADMTPDGVEFAVAGASTLAAWSCGFVGARGALYDADADELVRQIMPLERGQLPHRVGLRPLNRPPLPSAQCREMASICGV